jgi:3-phenylpropionate/trans-cinnamate dioxygenase ferredoxin subunit
VGRVEPDGTIRFVRVASISELPVGGLLGVNVAGDRLVLARTESGVRAFQGICTHQYAVLAEGEIEKGVLWCPYHGAGFDVDTGEPVCLPATEPLRRYEVRVDGEEILVAMSSVG